MIKPDTPRHGFIFSDGPEPWTTGKITDILIRETNLYSGLDCATVINSMPAFSISDPGGFKKRRRVMAVVDAE